MNRKSTNRAVRLTIGLLGVESEFHSEASCCYTYIVDCTQKLQSGKLLIKINLYDEGYY
jgi:hypothetical protein